MAAFVPSVPRRVIWAILFAALLFPAWPLHAQQLLEHVTQGACASRGGQFQAMSTMGVGVTTGTCFIPAQLPSGFVGSRPGARSPLAFPSAAGNALDMLAMPGMFGAPRDRSGASNPYNGMVAATKAGGDAMDMSAPPQAAVKECLTQVDTALIFIRSNATACGARADLLNSMDKGVPPKSYTAKDCGAALKVSSQRDSFEECGRVYYCAKLSLECVRDTAVRQQRCGMDISESCLQSHPVPQ